METLNATDAKREFGEVLLKVQSAPVSINKNGKPVAVVISASDYKELNAMREEWLKAELQKGMDSLQSGRVTDGEVVIKRLRKRLENALL
jgi:prevent-host-death family protein